VTSKEGLRNDNLKKHNILLVYTVFLDQRAFIIKRGQGVMWSLGAEPQHAVYPYSEGLMWHHKEETRITCAQQKQKTAPRKTASEQSHNRLQRPCLFKALHA
jgi:hypothetical protein